MAERQQGGGLPGECVAKRRESRELSVEVDRLAQKESRTRSELLREAFRQYADRRRRWDQLFAYGDERVEAGVLSEDVVMAAVTSRRRSRGTPTR